MKSPLFKTAVSTALHCGASAASVAIRPGRYVVRRGIHAADYAAGTALTLATTVVAMIPMAPVSSAMALVAAAVAVLPAMRARALSVSTISQVTRPSSSTYGAEQISGITYAGGNLFYAVDDNDNKLYPLTLAINRATGKLASGTNGIEIASGVVMSGASDMEGCAFDPCSGKVWISQETSALIREYDPETGTLTRNAPVPAVQKKYVGNYSLEALTISGDGRTMWTANEEALTVDGALATNSVGSVVRLTRFTRASVHSNWTAEGEWAYETQPIGTAKDSHTRSGVSGLCALPDGTLLVLERRCYQGGLFPDFNIRIYQVNFSGATDVSAISALKEATYTKTSKTLLWQYTHSNNMPNYEGICLGPRLNDGSSTLVLVGDGGSSAEEGIFVLKVAGLSIRTMEFAENENSEPYGGPYRYVDGASVTATIPGSANLYYETNLVTHASWSLPNHKLSGEGSSATFNVTTDDTFIWGLTSDSSLPMVAVDSFERIDLATEAGDIPGWSGEGWVATNVPDYYTAVPPGYPLSHETHDRVLEVDGDVTRTYDTEIAGGVILDTMVRATLPTADSPVADISEGIVAFHFDEEGHPVLQHGSRNGNEILQRSRSGVGGNDPIRTVLSENTYTNGQWLRVTIKIEKPSAAWCHVSIDGEACVTSDGARLPTDASHDGAWYRSLSTSDKISALDLKGTGAVDDVALYTISGSPEFDNDNNASVGGVPYQWLYDNGLPFDPNFDADGDGFTALREWRRGTDPWDKSSHPPYPTMVGIE